MTIMLQSGQLFDLTSPKTNEFNIEDIAHGLSHICRFVGQAARFYSVAEHSVLVSHVVPHSQLAALLHDAAEAFMGDVSTPLKRLLPEFHAIEERIERAIFSRFGVDWPTPPEVKLADIQVLAAEVQVLMPKNWLKLNPAPVKIQGLPPIEAKALFLARYYELR